MVARKRMFCSDITESDKFLDLPAKSQALYFHLCMRSDNDGFVDTKSVLRSVRRTERYLEPLIRAGSLFAFRLALSALLTGGYTTHNRNGNMP